MRSTRSLVLGAAAAAVLLLIAVLLLKVNSEPEAKLDDDQIAAAQRQYQRVQAAQARSQIEPVADTSPPAIPRPRPAPAKKPPAEEDAEADTPRPARPRLPTGPGGTIPVQQMRPLSASASGADTGGGGGEVKEKMDGANRLYDRADYEGAREEALRILEENPGQRRMLRIVVSSSCIMGDHDMAEEYFAKLPSDRDRRQMARRCSRYGVDLE